MTEKMTELSTVVINQSPFARENARMGALFVARIQEVLAANLDGMTIKSFSATEYQYLGLQEKIEFTLPNGTEVICQINTPRELK
jgi:hypothetical protein